MLRHDVGARARRASLAAGMALALVGRVAGFVPHAVRPTAATSAAASIRSSRSLTKASTPRRASSTWLARSRRTNVAPSSYVAVLSGSGMAKARRSSGVGARMMCAASSNTVEVSAGDLALEAQIKAKGDTIRELKGGGATKEDLKPHIEVSFVSPFIVLLCCCCWCVVCKIDVLLCMLTYVCISYE